jgi:predicted DNA-binding transcriptional regulator AlpA
MPTAANTQKREKPLAYRVNQFCEAIGIGRTSFYELVKQQKIKTVVVAGRRLIPAPEAERLLAGGGE